jgi:beta-lactam-binding protein with PASTA domain
LTTTVVSQGEPPPTDPTRLGRVWKQSPPAGAVVDQGTTVTVWVNPA